MLYPLPHGTFGALNEAWLAWLAVAGAAAVLLLALIRVIRWALRFRGTRVIRCPETSCYEGVHVDVGHAAFTGVWKQPQLRLDACSRWPVRQDCGQECLRQIENAPEDCLLRTIAARWYREKQCVYCGREVGELNWPDQRSALRVAGGKTVEWHDIPAQELPLVLEHAQPVCWTCHVAETFRLEHPELVTDRPGDVVSPTGERSGTVR